MCGIVGILGQGREAAPILLDALKRLEYRGYDSAGIATVDHGRLDRRRATGKLSELAKVLESAPIAGSVGIGHTRWATHGAATTENAHPHASARVAVVHNGIIENFRELREALKAEGHAFVTQTDTETIVHLCQSLLDRGLAPADAAAATLAKLEGAFALAFLFEGEEDLIVAARRGSPLAIGYGEGEMFVGSDALALAPLTNRIAYLEEGDLAIVTREGAQVHDASGAPVTRPVQIIEVSSVVVDKAGYKHFMLKEVNEQPTVSAYALAHYVDNETGLIRSEAEAVDFAQADRIVLVACGTAHYACHIAKYWFEKLARLPVEIDVASEFRYREPPLSKRDVAVFVSQSGETADTLAALRHAAPQVGHVVSVVNVTTSTIARESEVVLPILAGPEIGVASTKAFTSQLVTLATLAILAARQRGHLDEEEERRIVRILSETPRHLAEAIAAAPEIEAAARQMAEARDVLYLGRGPFYPLALEGALKLKEISYIHAEGYASGELKHGPIALVDSTVPVVVLAPRDQLFDKTVSNMQEVMARGGRVILFTDAVGAETAAEGAARVVVMPACDPFIAPIVYAVPAQLLAYYAAAFLGKDVDQPRNLAKSVTVE
ncbi:glutamine--fructose-6-phosphate transaminase (isomerizing) [Albimonas sp. CAU 1670]|uniref:glutamine--fructose-6-phosphate transaminase (isomerizing) n=1 Tax=Albimonas sp. CAU 1670 TaxID=3032599 RepID=UPI0023DAACB5|nr:glutamine--fructose-6-phosphate transaminase (isomerizing) [Albimonas sp. CAU 1670]MDF2233417.1 glutamine--fructose-6-phosphate transaminase (isomerizing) [Albimonas sp. CAU 1670]